MPFAREKAQEALERGGLVGVFGERERFAASEFEEVFVADGVGDVEA